MYSVLIVDDEKMIRDDVYELLAMENDLELDLSTAASAVEATRSFPGALNRCSPLPRIGSP